MTSRRQFLLSSGLGIAALASVGLPRAVSATPMGKRAGIQLYTINEAMRTDPAGSLKRLRHIGFLEVESAGTGGLSAKQFRGLLDDAGVACPSAHLQFDVADLGRAFDDAHALGARYAVSSIMRSLVLGPNAPKDALRAGMSLDEAKRTAELANRIGESAQRAGLQFAYHNHNFEFADQGGGASGYDVLLKETDPKLVKFEIDCGWMIFAGHDPIEYFKKYPQRFPMIHVKDFLPRANDDTQMQGAELGHGTVDYKPIFAAGAKVGLQHYFVEQEGPFARMSPLEAAQADYDYLRAIGRA
ncbi:MAG: sugar phosphate isomerase/epimerase family protein [Steroidobacteraceae bacterium]